METNFDNFNIESINENIYDESDDWEHVENSEYSTESEYDNTD